jgi:hypothetical protein
MCCRSHIQLCDLGDEEMQLVLRVAGFESDPLRNQWKRGLSQGLFSRCVWARPQRNEESGLLTVSFGLLPTIGGHSAGEHKAAGQLASILFKTMMVLGERGGGELVQTNLMGPCLQEGAHRILAVYPERPMLFENLCSGFREEIAHGVEQISGSDELD